MIEHYRFRSNWRGRLILQRQVPNSCYDSGPVEQYLWRDATAGDLAHYYNLLNQKGQS